MINKTWLVTLLIVISSFILGLILQLIPTKELKEISYPNSIVSSPFNLGRLLVIDEFNLWSWDPSSGGLEKLSLPTEFPLLSSNYSPIVKEPVRKFRNSQKGLITYFSKGSGYSYFISPSKPTDVSAWKQLQVDGNKKPLGFSGDKLILFDEKTNEFFQWDFDLKESQLLGKVKKQSDNEKMRELVEINSPEGPIKIILTSDRIIRWSSLNNSFETSLKLTEDFGYLKLFDLNSSTHNLVFIFSAIKGLLLSSDSGKTFESGQKGLDDFKLDLLTFNEIRGKIWGFTPSGSKAFEFNPETKNWSQLTVDKPWGRIHVSLYTPEKNLPTTKTETNKKTDGTTPSTTTDGRLIITEKNFGQFYTVNKGQQVYLRLSNDFDWLEPEPKTTGEITLISTNYVYVKDPGFREWQVSYTEPSTATIESNITTGTLGTDAEITKFFITLKIQTI